MNNMIRKAAAFSATVLPAEVKKSFYQLGPLTRLIRSALNSSTPKGFSQQTIAGGALKGFVFLLDMQTEKDYWLGTYETQLMKVIAKIVQPEWIIYDVGANIGYLTMLFAKYTGENGKVYAFEPLPENIERLKNNISLNNYDNRVIVIETAVADINDMIKFRIGISDDTGKIQTEETQHVQNDNNTILVPSISLDKFWQEQQNHTVQLVKLDIEGAECRALLGMRKLLTSQKPILLIETHGIASSRCVWKFLTEENYNVENINHLGKIINNVNQLGKKEYLIAIAK